MPYEPWGLLVAGGWSSGGREAADQPRLANGTQSGWPDPQRMR
jgi:hypothetical protein